MKTILIPTDFSDVAKNASNYALNLFKDEAVKYVLLNTFKLSSGQSATFEQEKKQHEQALSEAVKQFSKKVNSGSMVESILWMGDFNYLPQEILNDHHVDMIVMGTRGLSEVEDYIGKTNTGEFITNVSANIMIVPYGCDFVEPKNILFTTDFKNIKNHETLEQLTYLLKKYNPNLFVLFVNNTGKELTPFQKEIKNGLHDVLKNYKVSFHEFIADDVEEEIEDFMLQYNIDVISAIPMHNTFFGKIFHSSLTQKLAEHTTKPMLVLSKR